MLLEMVPEFKRDIANIRAKFGIPLRGYITDHEKSPHRYEYDRTEEDRANREADAKLKTLGDFFDGANSFTKRGREMKEFQREVYRLGDKFRLPYNFYHSSIYGLPWLIVRNRLFAPERNWEIETDLIQNDRALPLRWASIRAYMPLDDTEAKEAVEELNQTLRGNLPKPLIEERRMNKQSERLLGQVEGLLERAHGDDDWIPKSDRERKLLERADVLARDLFGYGIRPDTNDVH